MHPEFARLRELSNGVPGRWAFYAICALLEEHPAAPEEIDYLRGTLQRWPEPRDCMLPSHSFGAALSETSPAWLPLVRALRLRRQRDLPDPLVLDQQPWLASIDALQIDQQISPPSAFQLLRCGRLERLRHLKLSSALDQEAAAALAQIEVLGQLQTLALEACQLQTPEAVELSTSPYLAQLEALSLDRNRIDGEGVVALTRLPFRQLEHLELQFNPLDLQGARALVNSGSMRNLISLGLSWGQLGPQGCQVLAGATNWTELRDLSLYGCGVMAAGARALSQSPLLGRLQTLNLARNELGPQGVIALAGSRQCDQLETLILSHNMLGTVGLRALARSEAFSSLRELALAEETFTSRSLEELLQAPLGQRLQGLDLSYARLEPGAIEALACAPLKLEALNLTQCELDDEAFLTLRTAHWFAGLRQLNLRSNQLTTASARALAEGERPLELCELYLVSNPIDEQGARVFANNTLIPKLEVLTLDQTTVGREGARALMRSPHLSARLRMQWDIFA